MYVCIVTSIGLLLGSGWIEPKDSPRSRRGGRLAQIARRSQDQDPRWHGVCQFVWLELDLRAAHENEPTNAAPRFNCLVLFHTEPENKDAKLRFGIPSLNCAPIPNAQKLQVLQAAGCDSNNELICFSFIPRFRDSSV